MKTIRELYRIGTGPSSSHTMGPRKAAEQFLARHPEAASFEVTLYGSLAATGKGHMTDVAILDVLQPHAPVEILWRQPDQIGTVSLTKNRLAAPACFCVRGVTGIRP